MRNILIIASLVLTAHAANAQQSRFGEPATQEDIDKSFWAVFPDVEFLPEGEGNVVRGRELFEEQCNICHNMPGESDPVKDQIGKLFGVDNKSDKPNVGSGTLNTTSA